LIAWLALVGTQRSSSASISAVRERFRPLRLASRLDEEKKEKMPMIGLPLLKLFAVPIPAAQMPHFTGYAVCLYFHR